jgi:phage internal scaffolding protein
MAKFAVTGLIPETPLSPRYGDFTGIGDYHTALNQVIAAEDEFMSLPAQLRARFENDPAQLINFLDNPENYNEAVSLGLVNKKPEEVTQVIEIPQEKAVE